MRILIDSHVALWWLEGNDSLGPETCELIAAADEAYFSVVTPWELGIKVALGKLKMPGGLSAELQAGGFLPLPISADHAERAPTLPNHHRDPFDRMLIAQAQLESLVIVSADRILSDYEIDLVHARR